MSELFTSGSVGGMGGNPRPYPEAASWLRSLRSLRPNLASTQPRPNCPTARFGKRRDVTSHANLGRQSAKHKRGKGKISTILSQDLRTLYRAV